MSFLKFTGRIAFDTFGQPPVVGYMTDNAGLISTGSTALYMDTHKVTLALPSATTLNGFTWVMCDQDINPLPLGANIVIEILRNGVSVLGAGPITAPSVSGAVNAVPNIVFAQGDSLDVRVTATRTAANIGPNNVKMTVMALFPSL